MYSGLWLFFIVVLQEILYQSHCVQWYFVDHGQPRGPHTFEELQSFHSNQTIQNETLCWREGLPTWQTFSSLSTPTPPQPAQFQIPQPIQAPEPIQTRSPYEPPQPQPATVFAPATFSASSAAFSTSNPILNPDLAAQNLPAAENSPDSFPASSPHICVQCGKSVLEEDMLRFHHFWVCGPCKPAFMEAVTEGLVNRSQMTFAAVVSRCGAYCVDFLILYCVTFPIYFFAAKEFDFVRASDSTKMQELMLYELVVASSWLVINTTYYFVSIATTGGTAGFHFFGLRVVKPDGVKPGTLIVFLWSLANIINPFTFYLGVLLAVWDSEKRTLQDMICDLRLVYKRV